MKHIHSQKPGGDGYVKKNLKTDNNIRKHFCGHRIVATTFIPNPDNKPTVNHINMNRSDNRVVNLEWATYAEQSMKENRTDCMYKAGIKPINQYDLDGNFIKKWSKAIDVENELGIQRKNISKVLKGERKRAGGFVWKYAKDTDLEGEVWRKVPLEEYNALVSNMGRIRIREGVNAKYGTLTKAGYRATKLHNPDSGYKSFQIHRLIALTFIPNPHSKKIVKHIDGNKSNNLLDNLEW
jgi:hypothetical protein